MGDAAHKLHQLVDEVGLGGEQGRHPQGQVEGAVDPAKGVVHQVLGHIQNDLRQEQGGDHDAEQQVTALELKAAEAVSGNDRADNGKDDLGDNEAVGVDEGAPDADVAAVVLGHGVNVALQRGIGSQEADAGEDLGVGLEGGAHHPDQRVDHDNADKDQHKVLEETADFMGGRKFHFSILLNQRSRPSASGW